MATVGCTCYPASGSSQTWHNLAKEFSGYVGFPAYNRKQYYGPGSGSTWATSVPTDMQPFVNNLNTAVVCFKPAIDGSDWTHSDGSAALKSSIGVYADAYEAVASYPGSLQGLLKIVLYQEAQNVLSAPDYITCMQNYYPLIKAAWPHINVIVDLAGSQGSLVNSYFPGASYCDELGLDLYCRTYINQGTYNDENPAQQIVTLANTHGKPFGFCELGNETNSSPKPWPTHDDVKTFLGDYITPVMLGTGANSTPGVDTPSDCIWYESLAIANDNPITSATDYRAPYLLSLYEGLGGFSGIAQISGTVSLSARGSGGNADFGAATVQATATLSAHGSASTKPAAQVEISAGLSTSGGAAGLIVQQVQGASTFDYGLSSVEISTTQGSTLVVLAGWDLSTEPTSASMPAVWVSDSAANDWQHVATTSSAVTGSRCSAWICSNAQAVEWLSVSLTTFASSLAYTVIELDGQIMPQYFSLDTLASLSAPSSNSLSLNPGVTSGAGTALAVFAITRNPRNLILTGPDWQALPSVTAGAGELNSIQIFPFITTPSGGESLATTFTPAVTASASSAIIFSFPDTAYPPLQDNANFPVLRVEAGFGSTPGDTSQPPPTWVDITNRVIAGKDGTQVKVSSGRQYELATAEAGTVQICVDNHDGAFTPYNTASPFYPGIVLGTPVRVRVWWDGQWYPIGFGWTERLPQAWPDLPQWGIVKWTVHDPIAVTAAETMVSALNGDILVDAPYVLLPANEQYLTFSNGINSPNSLTNEGGTLGSYTAADAQGLLAQNYSRTNQRNGVYVDGVGLGGSALTSPAIAATGQTTNLLGSADTGFGTDAFAATAPTEPVSGPGLLYTDPNMPDPVSGNGVTVNFWVIIPATVTSTELQPTVFTAYGPPSSYRTASASLSVQIMNYTGGSTLQVTLADGTTFTAPFSVSADAQQITIIANTSAIAVYVNGGIAAIEIVSSAGQVTEWNAVSLGCPNYAYQSADLDVGSFTAFDLALYDYSLPQQRIVSQYNTGLSGQQNVDATTRMAQILAWAGIGVPRGGQQTFSGIGEGILQGPAYNLAGTTAADAINQVVANETGQVAAMPGGALTFFHKWALFNQAPVAVFGDNPDPTQGEIPSLQATNWGYDDTYLYNIAQVTQQFGANNLFVVTAANFPSQFSYYPRTALAQTITTTSALDPYDWANWAMALYSQPSLRVAGLSVDAASNPQAAFPVVLGLQQGQVVTVTRSPVGGATISGNVSVQKITHNIGATKWVTGLQLSPYTAQGEVLQLDTSGYDTVGSSVLA